MDTRDTLGSSTPGRISPGVPLSLVTVCLDKDTQGLVKLFVESVPLLQQRKNLEVYGPGDQDSVSEWMGNPPPDICLIDFDKDRLNAAATTERIHGSAPETAIFAVSSQTQSDFIIQAMRSGCSEYLIKPIDREQLLNAVVRVGGRKREGTEQYNAQVLAFMGAKGGCGVTTLVTQLAALLANSYSKKTLVVDLHPNFGDAALYLGVTKYRYHSFDLIENTDRMDAELLQSLVIHKSPNLDLVPAPEELELSRHIAPSALTQTFDFLRAYYEFILVDFPPGLNDQDVEFVRYSDHFYFITVAEVSALRNVAREVEYLTRKGIPQAKIHVVLNRHDKRGLISDGQIEKAIGRSVFWKVPNQYFQVVKSIQGGDPLSRLPRSEVLLNLKGFAEAIGSKPNTESKKKESRGILGLWGR